MKEYYQKLNNLIEQTPQHFCDFSIEQIKIIAFEYEKILTSVRSINDFFERNTEYFPNEFSSIQTKIHKSQFGKNNKSKKEAFIDARSRLISDMNALAKLIGNTFKNTHSINN